MESNIPWCLFKYSFLKLKKKSIIAFVLIALSFKTIIIEHPVVNYFKQIHFIFCLLGLEESRN